MTQPIRIAAAIFAAFLLPTVAFADILPTDQAMKDRVKGKPDAPITIIEYASLTCPHCAHFQAETLPKLEKDWIDTGKAKLIYRDFPLDKYAADASMIARCAPPDQYFTFVTAFFAQQPYWVRSEDPIKGLTQLAMLGGMSQKDVDACLANGSLRDAILQMRLDAQMKYDVNSTPTFVINGKKVPNLPYPDMNQILENAAK